MTSGQKIAFSMLISMLIFAGFTICANLKLFPELETRFYAQSKITEKTQQLDSVSKGFDSYISNILSKAKDYSENPAVSSYMEQNPSEYDVSTRRNLTEKLFSQLPDLNGIRIIDKNGRNVHYSSYDSTDILKQNGISKIYKNYQDIQKDSDEIRFSEFKIDETSETPSPKILTDSAKKRLIVSVPFYWLKDVYAGNIILYFNFYDVRQSLAADGILAYGEEFCVYANKDMQGGIVTGIPQGCYSDFEIPVLENWARQKNLIENISAQPEKILSAGDERYWTLLSSGNSSFLKVSGVYSSSYFELTKDVIWMIYVCVFVTVFLIVYLIFSIRQDSVQEIKQKIRQLQKSIIQEYINQRENVDWEKVSGKLDASKNSLLDALKKDLIKHSKKNREKISSLVEKGWSDIISVIQDPENKKSDSQQPVFADAASKPGFSMEELRSMIEDVLKTAKLNVNMQAAPVKAEVTSKTAVKPVAASPVETDDEIDELDEVEELEDVENVDEVEELEDVEEVGEVEELEDVEEVDKVEELEDIEELEDVEEIDVVESPILGDLEEYNEYSCDEEPVVEDKKTTFYNVDNIFPDRNDYIESTDSFIRSECFADVENLFADELSLGGEYTAESKKSQNLVDFEVHNIAELLPQKMDQNVNNFEELEEIVETEEVEEIENLTEEVLPPESGNYFSMTQFAHNYDSIQNLEAADNVIFENDGVYQISANLDYSKSTSPQNIDFKNLVDTVLHQK